MSRLISWASAALLAGLVWASSLWAQERVVVTLPIFESVLKELDVSIFDPLARFPAPPIDPPAK